MTKEQTGASAASPSLPATQVYLMAAICLVVGLVIGYVLRESRLPAAAAQPRATSALPSPHSGAMGGPMPTLADMKRMADKQAAPLLERLKSDPNNATLLTQVGAIYHSTHQFKEAAGYFEKAKQADPKSVAIRTKLATSLYREGDVDGAIAQLNQALLYDPKDANALFNLGLIRLQGKQDNRGALAAWRQLLKSNPRLDADRKATVEKLMAEAQKPLRAERGNPGAGNND